MGAEVELVSDGEGLAVLGAAADVERFFLDSGLVMAESRLLETHSLAALTGAAGAAAQVGATMAENSGRWVKLTKESAELVRKHPLMPTKTPGVSHAMIGDPGDIKKWLQISHTPSALLGGPLALTNLSTMMQQRAMQQQMDEIVEYLQEITEKIEDILRSQTDAVLADVIGVDLVIEEAFTIRDEVGRVPEVTWSKVQATSGAIARTQAYALRQLDTIARRLERKVDLGKTAQATLEAEPRVREWLAVLARTFQLQEGLAVLEIDRVRETAPEDLDAYRIGLSAARRKRREMIARTTTALLAQMSATVDRANSKVLFNPVHAPAAVQASNRVSLGLIRFHERLGIDSGHDLDDAKRWTRALGEAVDDARDATGRGAAAVRRSGEETWEKAAATVGSLDIEPATTRARKAAEQMRSGAAGLAGRLGGVIGARDRGDEEGEPGG